MGHLMDFSFDEKRERQIVTNKNQNRTKQQQQPSRKNDENHVVYKGWCSNAILLTAGRYIYIHVDIFPCFIPFRHIKYTHYVVAVYFRS